MVPLLAFIPWLGAILIGVINFFAGFVSNNLAIKLGVLSAIIALTVAFTIALNLIMEGVLIPVPAVFSDIIFILLPTNTNSCISALFATQVTAWIFNFKIRQINKISD